MKVTNNEYKMAPGPSRALTRGPRDFLDAGNFPGKKLLYHLFSVNINFKKTLKKFSICNDKRCLTCPFMGNEQRGDNCPLFCKSRNVVYFLECGICKCGYVGQTSNSLNIRITGHRSDVKNGKNKNSNDIEIRHFQMHDFKRIKIYILDIIPDKVKRLEGENIFMYRLKTIYPYGLNSEFNGVRIVNKKDSCIFSIFGVKDSGLKTNKRGCRGSGKNKCKQDITEVLNTINKDIYDIYDFNVIKAKILSLRNKAIKWFISNKLKEYKFKNSVINDVVLDLFKYKIKNFDLKNISKSKSLPLENLVISFRDNLFDQIKFNRILKNCEQDFPLKTFFNIRIANSYDKTLKNLICNYNQYSKNIDLIQEDKCYCNSKQYKDFIDPFHKHIVTGDLNIIEDEHLKKIMGLGSSFRFDFNYKIKQIFNFMEKDLDTFILKISYKYNWPFEAFKIWKLNFISFFKKEFLFHKNYYNKVNPGEFKYNYKYKEAIAQLKDKFIVATVDKAGNNFAVICKVFYKKLINEEYECNNSYIKLKEKPNAIIKRILAFDKILKINRNIVLFPYLFVTVKFHKKPIKFRFVTCGTNCYNYKAGKILFNYLNIILQSIQSNSNCYIIDNNSKIIDFIQNNSSKIKTVNTFDFENLFGSIPHDLIKDVSSSIFEEFSDLLKCDKEFWINLIKICIFENVLFNGKSYFKCIKGIPMGTSFSSAFANIFLYYYEKNFMEIKFYRYIDDIIVFNCDNFKEISLNIYPTELNLNCTDEKGYIAFLDLKIENKANNWLIGIYDKRNDFNFKVNSLTCWNSCISKKVLKNIIFSQITRIRFICNNKRDLDSAITNLKKVLITNCYPSHLLSVCY